MFRDFSRAQQRFLGLSGPLRTRRDDEAAPPSLLIFTPEVRAVLREQAYATGHLRGGPLFGSTLEGEVTVVAAVPGGYACLESALRYDPLRCDERYVLGWSDALRFRYGGQVDWIGQWVMRADSRLGPLSEHLSTLRRAVETDLVNTQQVLCCLGWSDARLSAAAYLYDHQDEQVSLVPTEL